MVSYQVYSNNDFMVYHEVEMSIRLIRRDTCLSNFWMIKKGTWW